MTTGLVETLTSTAKTEDGDNRVGMTLTSTAKTEDSDYRAGRDTSTAKTEDNDYRAGRDTNKYCQNRGQ